MGWSTWLKPARNNVVIDSRKDNGSFRISIAPEHGHTIFRGLFLVNVQLTQYLGLVSPGFFTLAPDGFSFRGTI